MSNVHTMRIHPLAALFLFLSVTLSNLSAQPWEKLTGLRLAANQPGDADSFFVTDGTQTRHLRLYLVDAPETDASDPTMARRLREQTRYFGLPDAQTTLRHGRAAREQIAVWLEKPFTAHTTGAAGLGRSSEPRVYAYVVTADGRDLGELLVEHGLARAHGVGRARWDGVAQAEQRAHLADLELAAALGRKGVWADSDPTLLAKNRAAERAESTELAAISRAASEPDPATTSSTESAPATPSGPQVDINNATEAELRTLPGIGPALARRIIEGRPYASIGDLDRVSGIGPATLNRLRERVKVATPE